MARRTAELLAEGSYVNLGTGIPTLVSNFIDGRDITLHGENGIIGYGQMVQGDAIDHDVFNASGQYVSLLPGASFFDSVTSFEIARGGRLDTVILGAYQVDQDANLANFSLSDPRLGGIGGAMDLIAGKQQLIVMMEHRDSQGRAKLVRKAEYPITAPGCVDVVVTDLAILRRENGSFVLEQVAEGFSAEEVQALTEMPLRIAAGVADT
jgi:3-oxoacid CoA-transferase